MSNIYHSNGVYSMLSSCMTLYISPTAFVRLNHNKVWVSVLCVKTSGSFKDELLVGLGFIAD
jgi:hypothetical protein